MKRKEEYKVLAKAIKTALQKYGFEQSVSEGYLMLAELLLKAGSSYYNSYTEELFLNSFPMIKKDRTPNKKGLRFLCSMFYSHSHLRPPAFDFMKEYRQAKPT